MPDQTEKPCKLLVFSDIHIVSPGENIIGLSPSERFATGLAHALAHHPDADHLVVLGDLVHHGRSAEYRELARLLADVEIPISFLMGNHDNREVFKTLFKTEVTAGGFVQQMVDLGQVCLITLDSLDPTSEPHHAGRLCAERLTWLERALTWASGKPVLLAIHHPPFATGFPGMDRIALQNPEPLRALLRDYPGPLHILIGHVHRTISGIAYDLPFTVFKSTCHQHPMSLSETKTDSSVNEPGAYGIVLGTRDALLVHSEDFEIAAAAMPSRDPTSNA